MKKEAYIGGMIVATSIMKLLKSQGTRRVHPLGHVSEL